VAAVCAELVARQCAVKAAAAVAWAEKAAVCGKAKAIT